MDGCQPFVLSIGLSIVDCRQYIHESYYLEQLPMSMDIHKKVWPEFFEKILSDEKRFELRLADFEVKKGDTLILEEWNPETEQYTGRSVSVLVEYIVKTKGLPYWSLEEIAQYGYQIIQFSKKHINVRFRGTIVEESVEDNRILNTFLVNAVSITNDEQMSQRWHGYTVDVTKDEIQSLMGALREGPWYAHFWNQEDMIVVYRGQMFEQKTHDKTTWEPARVYGRSIGIPEAQLDFLTS